MEIYEIKRGPLSIHELQTAAHNLMSAGFRSTDRDELLEMMETTRIDLEEYYNFEITDELLEKAIDIEIDVLREEEKERERH